jgi:hypothetical protein
MCIDDKGSFGFEERERGQGKSGRGSELINVSFKTTLARASLPETLAKWYVIL